MDNDWVPGYVFDEDYVDKYIVTDLPVAKEYYVDVGFYVLESGAVIYACPECGELVAEDDLLKISKYVPTTSHNLGFLESRGIDVNEEMLSEALDCYEAHLGELDLEPFDATPYLEDSEGFQYVVDFGYGQVAFDVAEEVMVKLLEEKGDVRTFQIGEQVFVTELWRVVDQKE